ncbi:hypothetical protein [Nonomuraea sp. NPDC001831]|uniref:hypothetical protein n=1 Tax=Nonomuraea sp. NPDC001831 TaxID=3364340 RepID=UPI0036B4A331
MHHWQRAITSEEKFALIGVDYARVKVMWITGLAQRMPRYDTLDQFLAAQPDRPFQASVRDLACDVAVPDPVLLSDGAAELPAQPSQAAAGSVTNSGAARPRLPSRHQIPAAGYGRGASAARAG